MTVPSDPVHLIGQVERDPEGRLWAVLYLGENTISREHVRSLRRGRRRITDMLLSAADTTRWPVNSQRPAASRGSRWSSTSSVGHPTRPRSPAALRGLRSERTPPRSAVDLIERIVRKAGCPKHGWTSSVPVLSCRTFDSWHRVSPIGTPGCDWPDSIVQVTKSIWRLAIPFHPTVTGSDVFVRPVLLTWSAGRDRGGRGA